MNTLIVDYFEPERNIVSRLKEVVTEVNQVFTPFSLADMLEASQPNSCLHVIYAGDKVPRSEGIGNNTGNIIDQQWLIVLAMRLASAQLQNTSEIRALAGPIIPKVIGALQGWSPAVWMRPLRRVPNPAAGYSSAFAYFPFMFEGRILT